MTKGLKSEVKGCILELIEKGKTTKEILEKVKDGEEGQIRRFIQYSKKKFTATDPKENKSDILGTIEYIDELESELKNKNDEIEALRSKMKSNRMDSNNRVCALNSKIETLKDINRKLLQHV